MRRCIGVAVAVAVVVGWASTPVAGAAAKKRARLTAFSSCGALVDYGRREIGREVPVRALPGPPVVLTPRAPGVKGAPTAPSPETTAGAGADDAFSGTNVQEAGVDEPDVVKSDGKTMFVIAGSRLLAVDVTGDLPKLLGSVALEGSGQELLLRGDRVLVVGSTGGDIGIGIEAIAPTAGSSETELTEVDVSDPAAMKIARTLTVAGSHVSARLTGGTARVVLSTAPEVGDVTASAARRPGLRSFVPETVIRSRISGRTFRRGLVPCGDVRRPQVFSGLDLLTVLTIDLDHGLFNVDRDAVMAGAQVVYASTKSLYVASQRYVRGLDTPAEVPPGMRTEIHRFDTSDDAKTTYASSGSVSGFVLNQYAMSEDRGVLRVASTDEPLWLSGEVPKSSSSVTVLRENGTVLKEVGRLGGLGTGERIYAVRFIGDTGYVVTFRQIDPLHVLDLGDPEHPRLAGELKIAGYSAYLHPIGDGLLLGVGQDASEEGRRRGAQVSVFDVSDPAKPSRLFARSLGSSSSSTSTEFDPHAFLWWAPSKLAVLPLQDYDGSFFGAVGLRIAKPAGIAEVGRVTHGDASDPALIERTVVVGDRLYSLSDRGVGANTLATFAPLGFLAFPEG